MSASSSGSRAVPTLPDLYAEHLRQSLDQFRAADVCDAESLGDGLLAVAGMVGFAENAGPEFRFDGRLLPGPVPFNLTDSPVEDWAAHLLTRAVEFVREKGHRVYGDKDRLAADDDDPRNQTAYLEYLDGRHKLLWECRMVAERLAGMTPAGIGRFRGAVVVEVERQFPPKAAPAGADESRDSRRPAESRDGPGGDGGRVPPPPAESGKPDGVGRDAMALAYLIEHPTAKVAEIAKAIGVDRKTLYKLPKFREYAEKTDTIKPRGFRPTTYRHKGTKTADGRIEIPVRDDADD